MSVCPFIGFAVSGEEELRLVAHWPSTRLARSIDLLQSEVDMWVACRGVGAHRTEPGDGSGHRGAQARQLCHPTNTKVQTITVGVGPADITTGLWHQNHCCATPRVSPEAIRSHWRSEFNAAKSFAKPLLKPACAGRGQLLHWRPPPWKGGTPFAKTTPDLQALPGGRGAGIVVATSVWKCSAVPVQTTGLADLQELQAL